MKVYILEAEEGWDGNLEIIQVFADKEKALNYGASIAVNRFSPDDYDSWQDEMEETGISKFDWAKGCIENGDWWICMTEWEVE